MRRIGFKGEKKKPIIVELVRGAYDRIVTAEIERSGHNQEVYLGEEKIGFDDWCVTLTYKSVVSNG